MRRYSGRFAPTPSGPLHFGSMIAAIASFCDARAHGGNWYVRIDDLDAPRVIAGVADGILRTLEAFSLHWDGRPLYQSANKQAYHCALHLLRTQGRVFPCACSRKEVRETGAPGAEGPVYSGACRNGLPAGQRARSLRLLVDNDTVTDFNDRLQGNIRQNLMTEVGDFVVYRSDGAFTYHFACVVDDALLGITDIVRGADLIDSTPRQILLQRLLGLPTPGYLHLPVAVNSDGEKLSKQTRAAPVDPSRAAEIIHAVLRFLGQHPPAELARWPAGTALDWAVKTWRRERLPAARAIASPNDSFSPVYS
ncbi:MAG: glutamyl-Q tRNA(Asp) ligase [Betaproteobacteria bacterium SG8_40]|jgi:glutamyl-Q tRNA(Asp) synthetase|nr:MAG: glutamyl-Q tRNA(Asp) ligase [Betaproteobacteria bacterium SG8_40]